MDEVESYDRARRRVNILAHIVMVLLVAIIFLVVSLVSRADAKPIRQDRNKSPIPPIAAADVPPSPLVGGRPAPCFIFINGRLIPYCGCSLSVDYFGRVERDLLLAANWLGFPKAAPAPGMAAVRVGKRRGHVMKLVRHVRGDVWRVYDPNSGGGLTRVHDRSIAGFTIVNPMGRRGA